MLVLSKRLSFDNLEMPSPNKFARLAQKFKVLTETHRGQKSRFSDSRDSRRRKHGGSHSKFHPTRSQQDYYDYGYKHVVEEQSEHIAFKSTKPGYVFPLNMINPVDGKAIMSSVEFSKLPQYLQYKFACDVNVGLMNLNLHTQANIAEANRIKNLIYEFTLHDFNVDAQLMYSFEDVYTWEDDIRLINGKHNAILQRIILSFILTLNETMSSYSHNTPKCVSMSVFTIGCIAGICKYMEYISHKQYNSEIFKTDLYSVIY